MNPGVPMENIAVEDHSAELEAAGAELKSKLPEPDHCTLTTMYGLCDVLLGGTSLDLAEHLFHDHGFLPAGEVVLSFLRFLATASELEATLFFQHDIRCLHRFDVVQNTTALREFERELREAQQDQALKESANAVKH